MQSGATACISQQAHSKHRSSAAGETKTETFAVTVTDDKGATATQNVVVTVTGAVVEDGTLSATGTVDSSDVDVTGKTATYTTDKPAEAAAQQSRLSLIRRLRLS